MNNPTVVIWMSNNTNNIKPFVMVPSIIVDNDKSTNERVRAIFKAMSEETDSVSMFCIVRRTDGVTFHSSEMSIPQVLFELEKFKQDLLAGRYGEEVFDLDL